jgi:uncharacterized membrane protein
VSEQESAPQTLVGISFGDMFRAREFLTAATRLASEGRLRLKDAVFVVKDQEGTAYVEETIDLTAGRTALSGALWAGLFGLLLGGPVGWIVGAGVGAGTGAVTAKVVDLGIPDEWVTWIRDAVQPGTTTLALLVEDLDAQALVDELGRFQGAHLLYANLPDAWLDAIHAALGEPPAGEPPSGEPPSGQAPSGERAQ